MAKRKIELADRPKNAKALKSRKNGDAPSSPKTAAAPPPAAPSTPAPKKKTTTAPAQPPTSTTTTTAPNGTPTPESTTFQIITGSYERVLHGFTATIPPSLTTGTSAPLSITDLKQQPKVDFSDTFLFNAHTSAIRCLALSPPSDSASKVLLATGSTDERINIYSLSKAPPSRKQQQLQAKLPSLHGTTISENAKNKEMGSLMHHSSTVTALHFPTRSKLLSASEDSTIAITRTRDWEPLSTIKAPIPKAQGRPSGDTAPPGEVPAGVNAFAVHPSMKLMLSVGRGEKCMRLWNLVTGKKAGVLSFNKDLLAAVGETRFASGEAKAVVWDPAGEEFAVAFDRGVALFGIDCLPKSTILPSPRTKVHRLAYLPSTSANEAEDEEKQQRPILLVSTEDGRILLYDTSATSPAPAASSLQPTPRNAPPPPPHCRLLAQIAGPAAGITSRIKDFDILPLPSSSATSSQFLIITGSSDGTVRLWILDPETELKTDGTEDVGDSGEGFAAAKQVGKLIATYATETRITCLRAFEMTGVPDDDDEEEDEEHNEEQQGDSSSEEEDEDSE